MRQMFFCFIALSLAACATDGMTSRNGGVEDEAWSDAFYTTESSARAHQILGLDDDHDPPDDPEEIAEGMALLRVAADAGDSAAQNTLGAILSGGIFDVEIDVDAALVLYEAAMESGNERIALFAGVNWAVIMQGRGERLPEAFARLSEAFDSDELDVVVAAKPLADALAFGWGTRTNLDLARDLYEAALVGDPDNAGAHWMLARGYRNGWFETGQDNQLAYTHYRAAAELDIADAAWSVGMAHLEGWGGVEQNDEEAYAWVARAADGGSVRGMVSRAVMLATAEGVARDPAAAALWYEQAARLGNAHAMRGLGAMHATGEVANSDLMLGLALLELGAEGGDGNAVRILTLHKDSLRASREEIDAAKRRWLQGAERAMETS